MRLKTNLSYGRNIRLAFVATVLRGTALGITAVVYNLYILSLGIPADVLGYILSAAPYAQALGSIPAGFVAELIGFRSAYLIIYGWTGLAQLVEVSTPYIPLIVLAAFVGGLGFSGDFVVRLPFLASNAAVDERARVFSAHAILHSLAMSMGALIAGYAPSLLRELTTNLTMAYRYILYLSAMLTLAALIPTLMLGRPPARDYSAKRSLAPYLWGMDRFTLQQAIISLLVGASGGIFVPFLNLFYVYHLGTTREFYGVVIALAIVPNFVAIALGPALAMRVGSVRAVTLLRLLIPLALLLMTVTRTPWIVTIGYWLQLALFAMSQPLSFAFAMDAATTRAKQPTSSWLNVTYWLGLAIATPVGGRLVAQSDYNVPLYLSCILMILAALCNQLFFGRLEQKLRQKMLAVTAVSETNP